MQFEFEHIFRMRHSCAECAVPVWTSSQQQRPQQPTPSYLYYAYDDDRATSGSSDGRQLLIQSRTQALEYGRLQQDHTQRRQLQVVSSGTTDDHIPIAQQSERTTSYKDDTATKKCESDRESVWNWQQTHRKSDTCLIFLYAAVAVKLTVRLTFGQHSNFRLTNSVSIAVSLSNVSISVSLFIGWEGLSNSRQTYYSLYLQLFSRFFVRCNINLLDF